MFVTKGKFLGKIPNIYFFFLNYFMKIAIFHVYFDNSK